MSESKSGVESVYCTKYALSTGVYKVNGREDGKYFKMKDERGHHVGLLVRSQWARTQAEAREQVKAMVTRRCAALIRENDRLLDIESGLLQGELPMMKGADHG